MTQESSSAPPGYKLVPLEPTPEMWGELARDIVWWLYSEDAPHHGSKMHKFLRQLGRDIPAWLTKEIPDVAHTPAKGDFAAAIYKAMIANAPELAATSAPEAAQGWIPVGERLPDPGVDCLVCATDGEAESRIGIDWCGHQTVAIYPHSPEPVSAGMGWSRYADEVTHWMPLPSPPGSSAGARPSNDLNPAVPAAPLLEEWLTKAERLIGLYGSWRLGVGDAFGLCNLDARERCEKAAAESLAALLAHLRNHPGAAPAAPLQPVAWRREWDGDVSDIGNWLYADDEGDTKDGYEWEPLFTAPAAPAQTWARGFDGSSVRAGPNHSTIEIWFDTHEQAIDAHKAFNDLIEAALDFDEQQPLPEGSASGGVDSTRGGRQ